MLTSSLNFITPSGILGPETVESEFQVDLKTAVKELLDSIARSWPREPSAEEGQAPFLHFTTFNSQR